MGKIFSYDKILSQEVKEKIINDYVNNLLSIREIKTKYNISSGVYLRKLLKEKIRTQGEANTLAHKKYPESFKLSDETKAKIRTARLKYMAEHPENTAWRQKNMSYPEKMFDKLLKENGFYEKYIIEREFSVFPYFIDFAFVNGKIAVEIDGSQHLLEERKKKDKEKDTLLKSKGWRVIRISENLIKTDWKPIIEILNKFLEEDSTIDNVVLGKINQPKGYIKKERNEKGHTEAEERNYYNNRKVKERPSPTELHKLLCEGNFVSVGKMFGVRDNTIRKWCKDYNMPYHSKFFEK